MYGILHIDRFRFLLTYDAFLNNNIFSSKRLILRPVFSDRTDFYYSDFFLSYLYLVYIFCLKVRIMRVSSPAIFSEDNLVSIERLDLPAHILLISSIFLLLNFTIYLHIYIIHYT